MSQKLSLDDFKWVKETSQVNEDFMKSYNEDSDIGYFIEADVQYPEELHEVHDIIFLPERMQTENVEKFVANLRDRKIFKTSIESWISIEKREQIH